MTGAWLSKARQLRQAALAAVLPLALVACIGSTPLPEEHFYRLPELPPAGGLVTVGASAPVISLTDVYAAGLYRNRNLVYVEDANRLELRQYHYHFWSAMPSKLIREQISQFMLDRNLASQIHGPTSTQASIVIRPSLRQFDRIIGANGAVSVAAALQFEVETIEPAKIQIQKIYRAVIPAADQRMSSSITAFGQALTQVLEAFGQDLRASPFMLDGAQAAALR